MANSEAKGLSRYDTLFTEGRIGGLVVSNRLLMPGMGTGLASPDGFVTDEQVNHYARRARGGVGVIITEITNVHATGVTPGVLQLHDSRFIDGLARLAVAIKSEGARAFCQLYHPGPQTSSRVTRHELVAPSNVPTRPANETPRPASAETVETIVESFVEAAERAACAGFDGVEFHGAHGYLICSFLSPAFNRRDDQYGGDTIRRTRMATEIVRRTRARLGPLFPISFRISAEDGLAGGIDLTEGIAIARLLEEAGADAISVSAGCYDAFDRCVQPMSVPQACNAALAAAVRQSVRVPVIVAGRINDPAVAESVLAGGSADFVAIGRGLLADPDFVNKARRGRAGDIRRCLGCNKCIDTVFAGKPIRCTVNPELGYEGEFAFNPAVRRKRVIVAGGGPAGMQAAAVAARRGHQVTLYERDDKLGGKLPLCAAVSWKRGFEDLTTFLVQQVNASGAQVILGSTVTAESIVREEPDAVIVACGAEPVFPDVPGLTAGRTSLAEDVFLGRRAVGKRVFIMGGSETACELAIELSQRGHDVTVARRGPRAGIELGRTARWRMMAELEHYGVRLLSAVGYEEVVEGGIILSRDGQRQTVFMDSLIVATGYRARGELSAALTKVVPEVHVVGDCVKARTLLEAIHEGARAGAIV